MRRSGASANAPLQVALFLWTQALDKYLGNKIDKATNEENFLRARELRLARSWYEHTVKRQACRLEAFEKVDKKFKLVTVVKQVEMQVKVEDDEEDE